MLQFSPRKRRGNVKERISAILRGLELKRRVAIAVVLCGLLGMLSHFAYAQDRSGITDEALAATQSAPLSGVTNSTQIHSKSPPYTGTKRTGRRISMSNHTEPGVPTVWHLTGQASGRQTGGAEASSNYARATAPWKGLLPWLTVFPVWPSTVRTSGLRISLATV